MAVRTSAVEVLDRLQRLRLRGVAARDVARVADPRHADLQQLRIAAAVWVVAIGAILHDRRMLPQKWAPPLGVATQAILIGRGLNQLRWIRASVWVMAAGAGNFPFAIGHVRGALQLCSPHLVAPQAQFRLSFLVPTCSVSGWP